jgi:hypothetical protein
MIVLVGLFSFLIIFSVKDNVLTIGQVNLITRCHNKFGSNPTLCLEAIKTGSAAQARRSVSAWQLGSN